MNRKQFLRGIAAAVVFHRTLLGSKNYSLEYQWSILTKNQKDIRDRSYAAGLPRGLEESLTAIAWQESSFGLPSKMENPKDPSGGVFGNSYTVVARRHFKLGQQVVRLPGIREARIFYTKPTAAQLEYVSDRLKSVFAFSTYHSVRTLHEGQTYAGLKAYPYEIRRPRGRDWLNVWSYYNGGHKGNDKYAEEINKKIQFMKSIGYKGTIT